MHDVIVVGGGPVGCFTASLLAKRGFDTLILERNPAVGHRVICTGLIGLEAFERFHLPRGSVINRLQDVTFISPSGIRFIYRPESPKALIVDRRQFDRDIADIALSNGAKLRCNSLVSDVRTCEAGLNVGVESRGNGYDLGARMVVVACGFNSKLTEKLGLERPTEFLQGAEAVVDLDGVKETEVYLGRDIAPESFAWVVPMSSEKARIGMTTREDADLLLRAFLHNPMIRDRIKSHDPNINLDLIPLRPIKKSFTRRVLVVGEAAGQVKSTTCGGIYYGLISAKIAVETIEEAFSQDRFDDGILKRYEQRWRHELGGELEIGYRLRQIFSGIEDKQIDTLFEVLNSDGIAPIIYNKAQFDWHKDLILMLSRHVVLRKYLQPLSAFPKRFTA